MNEDDGMIKANVIIITRSNPTFSIVVISSLLAILMELLNEIRASFVQASVKTRENENMPESLEIAFTTIATLLTENNTPAQVDDSSDVGDMINMIEKLEDDESFESYLCKVIAVSNFIKSLPKVSSQEQESVIKSLWKSFNRALWTLLQQVTLLLRLVVLNLLC